MRPVEYGVSDSGTVYLIDNRGVRSSIDSVEETVPDARAIVATGHRGPTIRLVITHRRIVSVWPGAHHEDRLALGYGSRKSTRVHIELEVVSRSGKAAVEADFSSSERQSWCVLRVSCNRAKKN